MYRWIELINIKLFKQYTHNIAMTLYKINPLRIEKIPLTIKNYPWPCGSKLRWIELLSKDTELISTHTGRRSACHSDESSYSCVYSIFL